MVLFKITLFLSEMLRVICHKYFPSTFPVSLCISLCPCLPVSLLSGVFDVRMVSIEIKRIPKFSLFRHKLIQMNFLFTIHKKFH